MADLLPEVQQIFRSVFDRDDLVITRESNAHSVEGWDSLAHINLVMALEKKYKVKFGLGDLSNMENVGDLLNLLDKKLSRT
jgi:acyl carrier protein